MPTIVVTQDGQTVQVANGDRVVIDIPGGGGVTIVAANSNVRNFQIEYGGDDTVADQAIVDLDSFTRDDLNIQLRGYDSQDNLSLEGAENVQIGEPNLNEISFEYGDGLSGGIRILDPGERDLTADPPPITICFADGTIIDTELGPRPIESLQIGDKVRTVDNGLRPVRWIGKRKLSENDLLQNPNLYPIKIRAGTFQNGLPWSDLIVSPQHRIRLRDWRAEMLYGNGDVLVPAKAFVGQPGVDVFDTWTGTYFHLLFDQHEMIWSNGLPTESLHPGEIALSAIAQMDEGFEPNKDTSDSVACLTSRPVLKVREARMLLNYAA